MDRFLFAVAILLTFGITSCNRESQTPRQPETSPQVTAVASIASNQTVETIEATTAMEDPRPALESMSLSDALRLAENISEIEMVFVEGGSMMIQGQEISVDSFYISKFVLTCDLHTQAHNWAQARGYLDGLSPWGGGPTEGCRNALLSWVEAIVVSNYLSIMQGLTPVYWLENRTAPILSPPEIVWGIFTIEYSPFFNDWDANGYRLPTEAEWEFAARGGNKSRGYRYAGSDILAEVMTNFGYANNTIYIPGLKKPNELGIHDMSGQSPEWVLGPWTEFGKFETMHNPGRMAIYDFVEPFYLIQKGRDHRYWLASSRPEERIRFQPDSERPHHDPVMRAASLRLLRRP